MSTSTTVPAVKAAASTGAADLPLPSRVPARRDAPMRGGAGPTSGSRAADGRKRAPGPTIGVTVEIPEPWRGKLQAARHAVGDPLAGIVPPHLTLLAPTSIAEHDLEQVAAHLASFAKRTASFTITLHGISSFMPLTSVVYVPVIDGGTACAALAADIRNGPVSLVQRFPFHPHVTVAQRIETEPLERVCRSLIDFEAVVTIGRYILSVSADPVGDPFATWQPVGEFSFTA